MRPTVPRPLQRSVLTTLLVAVALVCGPLAFAPAQAAGTSVSGTVTDSAGVPLRYVQVAVWVRDDVDETYYQQDGAWTDALGRYDLDLAPGTYKLRFSDYSGHVAEYYDNQPTLRSATAVVVGDTPLALAGAELESLPVVSGTVTSAGGVAIADAYVVAYRYDPENGWDYEDEAWTDDSGDYALPVRAGTYVFELGDDEGAYVEEYWEDETAFERATLVTVGEDDVAGISAELTARPVTTRGSVVNHTPPRVAGFAAVKQVLESTDGLWMTNPVTIPDAPILTRQWLRNGVAIPGATAKTYLVTRADLGAQVTVRVTGTGHRLVPQTVDSAPSGVVKWNSKVDSSSKPGRNKATLTIRPISYGGTPTGAVTIKLRNKTVKTVRLRNGRAVVTLRRLRKSQKYDIFYGGDATIHASRTPQWVRIKKS